MNTYSSFSIRLWLLALVSMSFVPVLQAETLPIKPYTARYKVYLKGCPMGESISQLTLLSKGTYRFVTNTKPYLNMVPYRYFAKSDFQFEANTLIPQLYVYNTQEMRRSKIGQVHFNWKTQQLENRHTSPNWEAPLIEGMQDKLTHSLQLRIDLIQGKKQDLSYTVAEESKILPYAFSILAKERLNTPIGILNTLKIKHVDHKSQITLTWLATDYEYLPIKMEHYRQGKKVGSGEILSYNEK